MHTGTGDIVPMDFVNKLKDKKDLTARFYKEIPQHLLHELEGMNRHERRKWYKLNKHRF